MTDLQTTSTHATSPMMAQFQDIKMSHPDYLLFYRMGDFYELFFEDAVIAAGVLDITLTKRGKHAGDDIPMCGVPVHSAEGYLQRLVRAGHKVAVCEQMEDPAEAKKRGSKSVVERGVVRLVTAGTLTEDSLLNAREHNYLVAIARAGDGWSLAWADISTGDFSCAAFDIAHLGADLARLSPSEILISEKLLEVPEAFEPLGEWKDKLTVMPPSAFDSGSADRRLKDLFKVAALDGFGSFDRADLAACGALVDYVALTQKGQLPLLKPPQSLHDRSVMVIDAATRRNLELFTKLSGERAGSLLSVIDLTVTGGGARLLADRLAAPLADCAAINQRLDMVTSFHDSSGSGASRLREDCRALLRHCPDVARALSRLTVGRGGPRDLAAIRDGLQQAASLQELLSNMPPDQRDSMASVISDLGRHGVVVDRLNRALAAELPILSRDGGFIAAGYHSGLDELLMLRDESRRLIGALEQKYRDQTGASALKVRFNKVLGYYIEVTPLHADKISAHEEFIHRQTLASAVRFTTVELNDLAQRINEAAAHALALELSLFEDLVAEVTGRATEIALAAMALAQIDVASALGELACQQRFCRPKIDDSTAFAITNGRHPVVEQALVSAQDSVFVPNDCDLGGGGSGGGNIWLLTGPNMAGKSTFLRQNALIAIMAQIGSYVPADSAHIGLVDRLFSRVGAADDLARGRSTFMVEMVETAAILNQAGERSLVILDEIGRGTATFDGLSIAWATIEHLHAINRCRALFATHYHELNALTAQLDGLSSHTMRVREWESDVVFLHEVAAGAADRSYGVQVAKLAGLPPSVVERAGEVLARLENADQGNAARLADDLPLFSATPSSGPQHSGKAEATSAIEAELAAADIDSMSPREAQDALYRLKDMLD